MFVRSSSLAKGQQTFKIKPVNIQSRSSRTLIKRTPADTELSIYLKPYIYLYNCKTKTHFYSCKARKNNYGSYLNWCKCFFHFELLVSQQYYKNETGKKFRNLLAINSVKYSSEFLEYLGHTGTPTNVQNNCIKLSGLVLM